MLSISFLSFIVILFIINCSKVFLYSVAVISSSLWKLLNVFFTTSYGIFTESLLSNSFCICILRLNCRSISAVMLSILSTKVYLSIVPSSYSLKTLFFLFSRFFRLFESCPCSFSSGFIMSCLSMFKFFTISFNTFSLKITSLILDNTYSSA